MTARSSAIAAPGARPAWIGPAGLFWLAWRIKRDGEAALARLGARLDRELDRLREALAQHKLDVATGYASLAALQSVEERLTAHLLRIEAKLDARGPA